MLLGSTSAKAKIKIMLKLLSLKKKKIKEKDSLPAHLSSFFKKCCHHVNGIFFFFSKFPTGFRFLKWGRDVGNRNNLFPFMSLSI